MDKKEKKRDVAVFANMLKELMQTQEGDLLQTLDRDLQHFLYGRIALLVKHNNGQPIGSLADISAVVGASLADITKEFVRGRSVEPEKLVELFDNAQANLTHGYQSRRPAVNIQTGQATEPAQEPATSE
jgi:hypothetical protein